MVSQIYPAELQLNKGNTPDSGLIVYTFSTKINDNRDDFDFEIVNFSFLGGDVPRYTSYFSTHPIC